MGRRTATATMAGDDGAALAGVIHDGSGGDGDAGKSRMDRTGGAGGAMFDQAA